MAKRTSYKSSNIRTITAIGLFSAIAFVLCLVFHFKAAFLTFDLKDSVMTVGAMLLSKLARLIEVAAIEEDVTKLVALHPILLDEIIKNRNRISESM